MKRGYTFSKDAFWRAIRNEDDRSIRLFCTGAPRSWTSSSNFDKTSIPQAARATLSDCHASENFVCDYQDLSKFDHYELSDALYADAQHGLISLICGSNIRRKLEKQVAKLQNAERTQLKDECQENYRFLEDTANKNTHIALRRNAVKMRIMELSAAINFRFPGSSLPEVCRSEFNIDFEQVLTEMRSH
ncbi:hypothetical protein [Phaeobacter porticola]|uniref:Uncharacterized protein n=1 Tax=Phaeobacter porticola TaxID=1844006 RepID=A0A1L3IAI4_9RHOB|nr:hypothetical protein [Phaeobacter porticola]APG49147.1 hypothetical protein PhaeoP97_03797 [Phaeobacter porticola]